MKTKKDLLLQDAGVETPQPKPDKDNIIYTSFFETPEYILEQINTATHASHATQATYSKFILYKANGVYDIVDSVEFEGKTIKPIVDELLMSGTVLLPSGVEEYGDNKKLISEIREFLFSYFELKPFFESFLPYLCLFYWVYDKFPFVPYTHFVGRTGTGKTTAEEVFGSICYKPIDASGSITMSPIFRTSNTWKGTLLLDEFDLNGDNYGEMMSFLKSGVSNKTVLRTEGDSKREVKAYTIKSPKVFTSENPINNAGLQSRTIVIRMEKNKRRVPLYRLGGFMKQAEILRNKLLLWRLRNINKVNLRDIEFGFDELKLFDGRVQQVITPIYYLSDEDTRKEILEFAQEQQAETVRERRDALDGLIFISIYDIYSKGGLPTISMIYEDINPTNTKFPVSEKKIGNVVRKILGFDIQRQGHEKISTVVINEDKMKELCEYYGTSFTSVACVADVASVANSLVDEAKELFEGVMTDDR